MKIVLLYLSISIFVQICQSVQIHEETSLKQSTSEKTSHRGGKLLNLFSIVRFANSACIGSSSRNGTCYTSTECSQRGGTSAGTCASGYGVCCIVSIACGATSSENCTYFDSGTVTAGQCAITICPCGTNICQLRLDFNTLTITGPSTATVSVTKTLAGQVSSSTKAVAVTQEGQCLTDTFSVTNPGGSSPPSICGINTGQHMYVDSSTSCNELAFQLGQTAVGVAAIATRSWSIKVTQYSCDYCNLAPEGCTQYFFGSTTGLVESYNYQGGQHLSDQNQDICVRRERNYCKICWTTVISTDFQTSGPSTKAKGYTKGSTCCGYGTKGSGTLGYDCVIIPGAEKMAASTALKNNAFCGQIGLVTINSGATVTTVCSRITPFQLRFVSDTFEFLKEKAEVGVKLIYTEVAC